MRCSSMLSYFQSKEERYKVGRALSRLLRIDAPNFLEVDDYGYAPIAAVVFALQYKGFDITSVHLIEIVDKDAQQRFEIFRGKIRAKAGHKYPVKPTSEPMVVPEFLYHGTSPESAKNIMLTGILRMGKAYVHLASTPQRAKIIGQRKSKTTIVLRIKAKDASSSGVRFWRSGQVSSDGEVILSDEIPPRFIEIENTTI
jgi:putative RNA 2'-phosphotransferase